jgi:hypothetical protein
MSPSCRPPRQHHRWNPRCCTSSACIRLNEWLPVLSSQMTVSSSTVGWPGAVCGWLGGSPARSRLVNAAEGRNARICLRELLRCRKYVTFAVAASATPTAAAQPMLFSAIRTRAEPTRSGSLTGSQPPQSPRDARPHPALIIPARQPSERRQATLGDGSAVPSKQRVAGSNPAGRTSLFSQFKSYGGAQADHIDAPPLTRYCHNSS